MTISTDDMKNMLHAISEMLSANRDTLNQLDAVLGDGDHGTAISTGFEAATEAIADAGSPADVMKLAATTLMNRMGGSSGALYGTLFLIAALYIRDQDMITAGDFAAMLQAGRDGVAQRGKSQLGDKTMLDALSPAVDRLAVKIAEPVSFAEALCDAAHAAEAGAKSTEKMRAKQGRAKFVGERAIGHRDAGAQSIALMFRAIANYWKGKKDA